MGGIYLEQARSGVGYPYFAFGIEPLVLEVYWEYIDMEWIHALRFPASTCMSSASLGERGALAALASVRNHKFWETRNRRSKVKEAVVAR